jgi:hypothetical protein
MPATQDDLAKSERESWRDGDWPAAALSFSARRLFLPLLRMRDASRTRSRKVHVLVSMVFYPAYALGMVAWAVFAFLVLVATPFLFFLRRTMRS